MALGTGALFGGAGSGLVLLVAGVVTGLPHGAHDHRVAARVFGPDWGRRWWVPFLAGYVALAAATCLAWVAAPAPTLLAFLALSVLHFGQEDAADDGWLGWIAHGGLPVFAPALFRPHGVEQAFSWLASDSGAAVLAILRGPVALAWIGAVGVVTATRPDRADRAVEIALIAALFAMLPPLPAFAIYFAAVHAPRASAAEGRTMLPDVRTLGFTLAAVGIGAVLYAVRPGGVDAAGSRTVWACFVLLASLTVPHMWLARLDGRRSTASTNCSRETTW